MKLSGRMRHGQRDWGCGLQGTPKNHGNGVKINDMQDNCFSGFKKRWQKPVYHSTSQDKVAEGEVVFLCLLYKYLFRCLNFQTELLTVL